MPLDEELSAHLSTFPTAPFLFVGSGISRRFLGLPAWSGLLEHFAAETGKPYARYASDADNVLPQVASLIAEDFRRMWWDDDRYAASRAAHPDLKTRESPLKVEVARLAEEGLAALPTQGELAEELDLLGQAVVEGVVTTNYDPLMERVFPDFAVFSGQDELLFRASAGVGEIYKIHGSYAKPESLVLTQNDYDRFRARNPYLAAKLVAMFVEHPVVFLGYGLGDPNVVEILGSIAGALTSSNIGELQDRLIFVQWQHDAPSPPVLTRSALVTNGVTIPVVMTTVSDFRSVFTALTGLRRRFPARLLRQLREQVYELVLTSEARGTVYVQDLDADADAADLDVVIGVGVKARLDTVGVVGLTAADLLDDVLRPTSRLGNPQDIVDKALPLLLRHKANTPVYRYLRDAGLLNDDGTPADSTSLPPAVLGRVQAGVSPLLPPKDYRKRGNELAAAHASLADLIVAGNVDDVLYYAPQFAADQIDLDVLRDFLLQHRHLLEQGHALQATAWRKCVCLYDLLSNKAARPLATGVG